MISRVLARRWTAVGLPLLIAVLSLPAFRPLMGPGYLVGHDALAHLFRLIEFHRLISAGDFYPRWFPDLATGHGYPLLNYYPPFTYYVLEAVHLAGLGFVDSIKLTIALSVVLSGLGMYTFVLQVTNRRSAAFLGALAYMYLPYRLVDIYIRSAFPEAISLAFLPFLLASFYALANRGSINYLVTSALLLASLLITHQISLFFVPLLLIYALIVGLQSSSPRRRVGLISAAALLGFAISSFFWLPAIVEVSHASTYRFNLLGVTITTKLMELGDIVQRQPLYDYNY